jgi:hypothetical protein
VAAAQRDAHRVADALTTAVKAREGYGHVVFGHATVVNFYL